MKLNWNFPGVLGCKTKNLPWGEYGYFLELHIFFASAECLDSLHASLSSMLGLRHQQHIHILSPVWRKRQEHIQFFLRTSKYRSGGGLGSIEILPTFLDIQTLVTGYL